MNTMTKKLALLTLVVSSASFGQTLVGCKDCGTNTYRKPVNSYSYSIPTKPSAIVYDMYTGGKLDSLVSVIESLDGRVNYYTYGEKLLPLKMEIGSLKTIQAVYGSSHKETLEATITFLGKVDANWEFISQLKYTDMFFETINYFELVILQLKRETYL